MDFTLDEDIWVPTSGSHVKKMACLSKKAFLLSAEVVNQYLGVTGDDIWLNPLPASHVGGLSIKARCFLSGAKEEVFPDATKKKWDPDLYYQTLGSCRATLSSLVPAQIKDLIGRGYKAPPSLRLVLVGGAAMDLQLLGKGWPLVPTYGCTECCSQIATGAPDLELLPHIEAKTDDRGVLWIKSEALLKGYLMDGQFVDPKVDGWFCTQDHVNIEERKLTVLGRGEDFLNIGGETVSFAPLKQKLESLLKEGEDATLIAHEDERLGQVIHLCLAHSSLRRANELSEQYNGEVASFEKIRKIHFVDEIPRSPLGKVLTSQLLSRLK